MKKIHLLNIIVLLTFSFYGINLPVNGQGFTVVFYNTENLYDTIDDPKTYDSQYLPDARVPWNTERYKTKLQHIAQVCTSIKPNDLPALIGLCEVENFRVLNDLVSLTELNKGNYGIVHFDSPDKRGIDNALLYQKDHFSIAGQKDIPVILAQKPDDPTRSILYVKGVVAKSPKDTLHIFVNHWPSRSEGQAETEQNRIDAAKTLKMHVDSLFSLNKQSNILIMGDFNDEPENISLTEILKANFIHSTAENKMLINLMDKASAEGKGTIYFDGWQIFDQIIVSKNLLEKTKGLTLPEPEGKIFSAEWLLYTPAKGDPRPNRTMGNTYFGGYSDHLPVYVEFKVK